MNIHSIRSILTALLLVVVAEAGAVSLREADSAYVGGDYRRAASLYEQVAKEGVSASLYYNLGNSYYRCEEYTRAILNYERALLLAPGDADIKYNLQMAQAKTVDKIVPESEMFFITWIRSVETLMSADGWAWLSVATLLLCALLWFVYLFASRVALRKVGFFVGLLCLVVFAVEVIFAFRLSGRLDRRDTAIVMSASASVKSAPSVDGTEVFILHEGTKVRLLDESMTEWCEIRVADGKQGWIMKRQIENI